MVASIQKPHRNSAVYSDGRMLPREERDLAQKHIALAGNPNVGKSAIFNALTGLNADVSNYPGTTIDVSRGRLGKHDLVDTPGVYGISSFNDEERIARRIIVNADTIVNVASALSLDRDLFLTLQLIALGKPMLLVINQWDEAQARGLQLDCGLLEQELGIPVLQTVATRGEGIADIESSLPRATTGNISTELHSLIQEHLQGQPQELVVLALEGDAPSLAELNGSAVPDLRTQIYRARRQQVNQIYGKCVNDTHRRHSFSVKFGRLLLHPWAGSLSAIAVCYLVFYQLLGVFVAGNVVDFTEKRLLRTYYEPVVEQLSAAVFPCRITVGTRNFAFPQGTAFASGTEQQLLAQAEQANTREAPKYNFWFYRSFMSVVGNTICGEYGVLTLTVTYLFGLLMPLVAAFYFSLALLEDSGYLPRLAVLVDRVLNKFGLNGRAIIPLILGLGCVTMATVTTRLLSTRREKIIASALLGVAIPCSAQLGIVSGTLAKCGGFMPWAVYGTIIGGMLAATGVLLNMVMPGKSQPLMIDLPPMRLPRWQNVCKKTWTKSFNFMQESIPMFCLAGLVVTAGQVSGLLDWLLTVLQPMTVSWLRLPADPRVSTTFVLGIVRRDFAAFGLTDVHLSATQAVVAMVVITLFVPCIATVGVMMKERGWKIALTIWAGSLVCAFGVGGLLARVLPLLMHG